MEGSRKKFLRITKFREPAEVNLWLNGVFLLIEGYLDVRNHP